MAKAKRLKSQLFVSICIGAMVLGFVAPNSVVAQTTPQNARPLRPISISQVLRIYGINKQSADFTYTSKQVNSEQAVFQGVRFGSDVIAETMTISREQGGPRIQIRFDKVLFSGEKDNTKAQSAIIIDGSPSHVNGAKFNKILGFGSSGQDDFTGDIKLEKVEIQSKEDGSLPLTFDKIDILNLQFKAGDGKFDSVLIEGFGTQVKGLIFKFNQFNISGISDGIFDEINKTDKTKKSVKSNFKEALSVWNTLGIGILHLDGLKISLASVGNSRPRASLTNSFGGFELASFDIRDFTPNNWGHFGLLGIKAKMTIASDDISFKLNELSFSDLNLEYYKAIFAQAMSVKNGNSADTGNLTMAQIYKGGPLDAGIKAFSFKGFETIGMGGEIKLDNLSFNSVQNNDKLITQLQIPQGKFEINVTDKNKTFGKAISQALDALSLEKFTASWGGNSVFEPNNDRIISTGYFTLENFASLKSDSIFDGMLGWQKQTKVKDIFAASQELVKPKDSDVDAASGAATAAVEAATSNGKTIAPPTATARAVITEKPSVAGTKSVQYLHSIGKILPLYKGIRLVNANFEFRDLGALNRLIVNEAAQKGKSPTQIRQSWREPLGQYIATKSKPAILRQIASGFSKLIGNGGALHLEFKPNTPFDISTIGDANINQNTIGLSVTNPR